VRLDGNDYSVHPAVIGGRIEVVADLAQVRAFCDDRVVANHQRIWTKHQTLTDPEHLARRHGRCAATGSSSSRAGRPSRRSSSGG